MTMNIALDTHLADAYRSPSQKARVLTEGWVHGQAYCPNCGKVSLEHFENNREVADFYCDECHEEFELKSKKTYLGNKIMDGAFEAKIRRLNSATNPNLFILNYDNATLTVKNFLVIPKHFFTPKIIEKRKALSPTAERANWVGSNILLESVPLSGRIYLIKNNIIEPQHEVFAAWRRTLFLRETPDLKSRGWLLDVMTVIEKLGVKEFSLSQVYKLEDALARKHPDNKHVKDKIRQQLQVLRIEAT